MSIESQMIMVGQTIRLFRKKVGLTQRQLAELAGVGKTVVFDIEKGKPSVRFNTLLKILGVLTIHFNLQYDGQDLLVI